MFDPVALQPDIRPVDDPTSPRYRRELRRATEEFESLFLARLFRAMRETIPEGGVFEDGFERRTYEQMLDGEFSRAIAHARGLGIADMLYREFTASLPEPSTADAAGASKPAGADIPEVRR